VSLAKWKCKVATAILVVVICQIMDAERFRTRRKPA